MSDLKKEKAELKQKRRTNIEVNLYQFINTLALSNNDIQYKIYIISTFKINLKIQKCKFLMLAFRF